jgi:hypothetical protein
MPNTLTALAPVLYSAAQEVSAEPFGVVSAINTMFDNKGVARGDKVRVPVAPTRASAPFTPANISTTGTDAIASNVEVEITKSQKVAWHLTGEQIRSLQNGGTNAEWVRQLVAQGMRTLRNEAEVDAAVAVKEGASRAAGTAGTTPFATSLSSLVDVRKILRDNGAPMADLQLVVDTNAEVNLLNLGIIQQAYAAGSDAERRQGRVARQFGFQINQSAGLAKHVKGTALNFDVDLPAGYNIGDFILNVDGGDGGTLKAGDILTLAGDTNKYVSNTAIAALTNDHLITLGRPGLRQAVADGVEITIGNDYNPNLAFERNAVVGIMRPPLIPANPTINQMIISDSMGMSYLLLEIAQYGQITWEIHLAWGFKVVQPEHVALLLG